MATKSRELQCVDDEHRLTEYENDGVDLVIEEAHSGSTKRRWISGLRLGLFVLMNIGVNRV